jgi:hypothetical protein
MIVFSKSGRGEVLFVFALCAVMCPQTSPKLPATAAPAIHPPTTNHRLPEGAVLHYKAEWHALNAGVATLSVDSGKDDEVHLTGIANATGFVSHLYHVHDVFEANFTRSTFCSNLIHKHTEEGSRRRDETIRFDYAKKKSIRDELDMKNGRRMQMQNDIPPCATDVLSALWYVGSLPLAPGATYSFPLNDGAKTAIINLAVEASEQVKTGARTFNAIRVQPTSDSDLIKKRGKVWVWYSNDAARLPVQIRGRMGWGTITMTLDRIERPAAATGK